MRVALPSRKNLQPATIATRPTANDGAYEPVRSYTNPASAGPSPAPLRQPSPTTLMIVASAASPNASGTAFTIVLSAPAPPRPKTTSVTGTAQAGRPATNATRAAARRDGTRLGGRRIAHAEAGRHADDGDERAERDVRRAPAEAADQPRGERPRGEPAEVEAAQHDGQRHPPARLEPARDGGRREHVDRRHPDADEEAVREIEVPERVDARAQREADGAQRHGGREHAARPAAVGDPADDERGHAAHDEADRQRHGHRATAPAERVREHGKKDAERRHRGGD